MDKDKSKDELPPNNIVCPALNMNPPHTPHGLFDASYSHFDSIPWTAKILKSEPEVSQLLKGDHINISRGSTKLIPFIPNGRNPHIPTQDQFLATTLQTPTTLPYMLCLFHVDPSSSQLSDPALPITQVTTLFSLGPALSSWPGIAHGGMICAMVDEGMGVLTEINIALGKTGSSFASYSVTGNLEIRFIKAVPLEGEVRLDSWIEESEGRKTRIRAEMRDKNGVLLITCSSLWVSVRAKV